MFRYIIVLSLTIFAITLLLDNAEGKIEQHHLGIAYSGGGFKSVADQTGLTAGLLACLMKKDATILQGNSPLKSSGLYEDVTSISSISGGSWFTSTMAYSPSFCDMVEDIAKIIATGENEELAVNQFNKVYSKRFNDLGLSDPSRNIPSNATPFDLSKVGAFAKDIEPLIPSLGFGLDLLSAFAKKAGNQGQQLSWVSLMNDILGPEVVKATLGDPVQDWCEGKKWTIISTALVPSIKFSQNYLWSKFPTRGLSYYRSSTELDSFFVPTLFSTVLGKKDVPAPYKSGPASSKSDICHYTGIHSGTFLPFKLPEYKETAGFDPKKNGNDSFSDMPVIGPVAASSAAVGFASIFGPFSSAFLSDGINANPAVCFSTKLPPSKSFASGQAIIDSIWEKDDFTESDFNKIVMEEGVICLIDGGAVDPFGIASALASGATDVFCVNAIPDLLSVDSQFTCDSSFSVFERFQTSSWNMFEPFRLFLNPNDTEGEEEIFDINAGSTVKAMKFRTLNVKTVKNTYFGVEEGRDVKLHVFSILHNNYSTGSLVAGLVNTFDDYGVYIKDIMKVLTMESGKNQGIVKKMLSALKIQV